MCVVCRSSHNRKSLRFSISPYCTMLLSTRIVSSSGKTKYSGCFEVMFIYTFSPYMRYLTKYWPEWLLYAYLSPLCTSHFSNIRNSSVSTFIQGLTLLRSKMKVKYPFSQVIITISYKITDAAAQLMLYNHVFHTQPNQPFVCLTSLCF